MTLIGHEDLSFVEKRATEKEKESKNHYLDEYDGRPTIETIRKIIIRKRQTGDADKKIWVTVEWALEMAEHYTANTSYTYSMMHNAPHKLWTMEKDMLKAEAQANLEHKKCQDLIIENALITERMEQMASEHKEKEAVVNEKLASSNIIKLPISRVSSFLAFYKNEELESPTEHFYIKIDDNGNMQRIVRSREELE